MRFNQFMIYVKDLKRSLAFYKRLGLKQIVDSPHYARMVAPDNESTFSLHLADEVNPGTTKIYFEYDHLDKSVESLKHDGFVFETELTDQEWLWREIELKDPDGYRVCLFHAGKNRLDPPWKMK